MVLPALLVWLSWAHQVMVATAVPVRRATSSPVPVVLGARAVMADHRAMAVLVVPVVRAVLVVSAALVVGVVRAGRSRAMVAPAVLVVWAERPLSCCQQGKAARVVPAETRVLQVTAALVAPAAQVVLV